MTVLEQVAKQLNVDLEAVRKAQIRAQAIDGLARAIWHAIQVFSDDESIETIDAKLVFDENGMPKGLSIGIGTVFYDIAIAEIDAKAQAQTQAQTQAKSKGNGNWDAILDIAQRYGISVSDNEKRAIAWYLGNIVKRITKWHPEAKNDAELVALAQKWLNEANNAQARGKTLADLGLA